MAVPTNDLIPPQDHNQNIDQDAWVIRLTKPVRRADSAQYLVVLLISYVITVIFTRLFLGLSNYPQLGIGELHISHILWGGLLLFLAILQTLLISNRRIFKASSILAGIGLGLFVDEVGKFITQNNDYFYPPAAPIIYIFFMFLLILAVQLRRQAKSTPRSELHRALEILQDWIDHPLNDNEQSKLINRLEKLSAEAGSGHLAILANNILDIVQQDTRPKLAELPPRWTSYRMNLERRLSERLLRLSLAIGLILMAFAAIKNPISAFVSTHFPNFWGSFLMVTHSGRWFSYETAPVFFQARLTLEIVLGVLLITSGLLLFYKQARFGIPLAFGVLILYLVAINPLLFYFEQFSTIILVLFQGLLISGLIYYRRHFLADKK